MFLSSADWMPRNFHRRVEVMFPIEAARSARAHLRRDRSRLSAKTTRRPAFSRPTAPTSAPPPGRTAMNIARNAICLVATNGYASTQFSPSSVVANGQIVESVAKKKELK